MIVSMNIDKKQITVQGSISHDLGKVLNKLHTSGWTVLTVVKAGKQ